MSTTQIHDRAGLRAHTQTTQADPISAIIVGTSGDDQLDGTSSDDQISGLGGIDLLRGLGGADVISGGDGEPATFQLR